jgi:hypothetical protein
VGREDDGAVLREVREQVEDDRARVGVELPGRFVGEDDRANALDI